MIEVIHEEDMIGVGYSLAKVPGKFVYRELWILSQTIRHNLISYNDQYGLGINIIRLICDNSGIQYSNQAIVFRQNESGQIYEHDVIDNAPVPGDWWGLQIRKPLDFDQHPGNIAIHQYLIGREPKYKSENVVITHSGKKLVNHPLLGWIESKTVRLDKVLKDELKFALSICK